MLNNSKTITAQLESNEITPFLYLKKANELLSNKKQESEGRELIIRALSNPNKFQECNKILKDLVRKSGLFPYLDSEFNSNTIEEDFIINIYKSNLAENFIFHSMQFKIFNLLMHDENIVLSAPTSMGKSVIIDALIASNKYNRIVCVVPTIALIDETRRRIHKKFGNMYEVIHHNTQNAKTNNVIYILTQERVNEREDIENIDLFIIDEFYKLAFKSDDDERAISLNIALSKLISVSKQFYMIGPNIDHIKGIGSLSKQYKFISSSFNTVALNMYEYNISPNDTIKKNEILKEVLSKNREKQTIIYCKSPAAAAEVAKTIIEMKLFPEYESTYRQWVEDNYSSFWIYGKSIKNGIGIHHGSLPRAIQQYTVDLFNKGKIKTLICTSTIIEGVNTIAENVIIYDNKNGINTIDSFTHNNIKGRAGRMKVHFIGNVYCLEEIPIQTIEEKVIEIPLGTQTKESPYNLLAGIQAEHINNNVKDNFESFLKSCKVPIELIKKHSTFKIDILEKALTFVEELTSYEMNYLCNKALPKERTIKIIIKFIKLVASTSLSRVNLHFDDSTDLDIKFKKYLYSESYQEYINKIIEWLEETDKSEIEKSTYIDTELKIIRNIFGYSIPKSLILFSDMINYVRKEEEVHFRALISIFENNHIPNNFSALEEMGIPIQTLDKLVSEELKGYSVNDLSKYLLTNLNTLSKLDDMDRLFIKRALLI